MEDLVKGGEVYVGSRLVLAVPIESVHAEREVLKNLGKLKKQGENDFLLIYSYLSPCSKCTDRNKKFNILKIIENQVYRWHDGAFVFTKVFSHPKDGSTVTRDVLETSLTELSDSMGGLQYIFRCDEQHNPELVCHSCSVNHRVSEFCIDNNAERERSISRERSRSFSGSRGGGSSRKREMYRSQRERSISSGNSREAGKHAGGGRSSS